MTDREAELVVIRRFAKYLRLTPLHPQWLLPSRQVPQSLKGQGGYILDIGAADRWVERDLSASAQYFALDYPATGREMYAARPDVFADALALPFAEKRFDGVICFEVLEHVTDPAAVFLEIARVLKNGGHVWISMPFLYPLHDAPHDFQRYTEFGLRRDATLAGLKIMNLKKVGHAIRTSGLLLVLALAGSVDASRGLRKAILLPFALILILLINCASYLLSMLWPDWESLAMGYELEAQKT